MLENLEQLDEEQIKYKTAIILTVFTGVRLGELMGLEWNDIDFRNGIVSINRSSQYLADTGVFTKVPKQKALSEKLQYLILSFLYLRNISYGMMNKIALWRIMD